MVLVGKQEEDTEMTISGGMPVVGAHSLLHDSHPYAALLSDSSKVSRLRALTQAASRDAQSVDMTSLLRFIFPPELQHSLSTGRLIAFGQYGPLDDDAKLRCGYKGSHILQVVLTFSSLDMSCSGGCNLINSRTLFLFASSYFLNASCLAFNSLSSWMPCADNSKGKTF